MHRGMMQMQGQTDRQAAFPDSICICIALCVWPLLYVAYVPVLFGLHQGGPSRTPSTYILCIAAVFLARNPSAWRFHKFIRVVGWAREQIMITCSATAAPMQILVL